MGASGITLSVVTPAYDEAENLPDLHARLCGVLAATAVSYEWIVVDDHSADATFSVVATLAAADARVRGIRLARRSGAHAAIRCGMLAARGDAVALLAADLQDPPELLLPLMSRWRAGSAVVWAVWRHADAEAIFDWSRLYYRLLRLAGVHGMPAAGAGSFLIDRQVVETLREHGGSAVDVMAFIGSLGAPSAVVTYDRPPRVHGRSGWTFRRKVAFAVASLVALSPLRPRRPAAAFPIEAQVGGA